MNRNKQVHRMCLLLLVRPYKLVLIVIFPCFAVLCYTVTRLPRSHISAQTLISTMLLKPWWLMSHRNKKWAQSCQRKRSLSSFNLNSFSKPFNKQPVRRPVVTSSCCAPTYHSKPKSFSWLHQVSCMLIIWGKCLFNDASRKSASDVTVQPLNKASFFGWGVTVC